MPRQYPSTLVSITLAASILVTTRAAVGNAIEPLPCDCNNDRKVAISELISAVNALLFEDADSECLERSSSDPLRPRVHDVVGCVRAALDNGPPAHELPNIVVIVGDDHGWSDSSFMGSTIVDTPNLDALAAEGTLFTNAHSTASICQPALKALLAGVHHSRWALKHEALKANGVDLPSREDVVHFRTLPEELGKVGYRSWQAGKHWEGNFQQAGFTHGLAVGPPRFLTNDGVRFGREGWGEGTELAPLREFLDEVGEAPFLAWVAPLLPHVPFDAPEEFRLRFAGLGLSDSAIDYYANVSWLDALVGRLVAEIDARGLREDTLIVYLSDNGWEVGDEMNVFLPAGQGKSSLFEGGTRTPLIFNWPGEVPAAVVRDDLVSLLDIFPTVLDYARAEQLPDRMGHSLKDAVEHGTPVGNETLVTFHPGSTPTTGGYTVRTQDWHYLQYNNSEELLFAIRDDPFETEDLAAMNPLLLERFRSDAEAWQRTIEETPLELFATPLR